MTPQEREVHANSMIRSLLTRQGQWNLEDNINQLHSTEGGFVSRFDFFVPFIPKQFLESILISGCSAGSEHFVARRFGFDNVFGTEVDTDLVEIAKFRLEDQPSYHVDYYDGMSLPYADASFSVIYSGHVIEHTSNPFQYFCEHVRVLKPGGYFFLEFPNRYHYKELHTGTLSCEWLPARLRSLALRLLENSFITPNAKKRELYRLVRTTLHPIGLWQIRHFLKKSHRTGEVVAVQYPALGYVRCLLKVN